MDVHDAETRSRNMASVRRRDTGPELSIRQGLHRRGFRFRLDDSRLPGRPDIVLSRWRTVVFVHGCFWHGHECNLFRWPLTRREFWQAKIGGNSDRDRRAIAQLSEAGWRVLTIWECALKGSGRLGIDETVEKAAEWIRSGEEIGEVRGRDGAGGSLELA